MAVGLQTPVPRSRVTPQTFPLSRHVCLSVPDAVALLGSLRPSAGSQLLLPAPRSRTASSPAPGALSQIDVLHTPHTGPEKAPADGLDFERSERPPRSDRVLPCHLADEHLLGPRDDASF